MKLKEYISEINIDIRDDYFDYVALFILEDDSGNQWAIADRGDDWDLKNYELSDYWEEFISVYRVGGDKWLNEFEPHPSDDEFFKAFWLAYCLPKRVKF